MQIFLVSLKSRSFKTLSGLIKFITFYFKKTTQTFINYINFKKLKKKQFSLLKSPHVHKKSQEHFEQRIYNKNILILCFNVPANMFFLVFKKLVSVSFFDVSFKIKSFTFEYNLKFLMNFLNLNNLVLNNQKFYSNRFFKQKTLLVLKRKKIQAFNFLKVLNVIGAFKITIVRHF